MSTGSRLPEAFVWWLWENARAGRHLTSVDGQTIHVIYPGRRWGNWGPDFRGAVIALDGRVLRGDIEVHVRARDWFNHGHDRDPEYSDTILHVVFSVRGTALDGGPPLVALEPAVREPVDHLLAQWEKSGRRLGADTCLPLGQAQPLLREAGLARLRAKAVRFEGDLHAASPETVLLSGLIECLGYAANVAPMRSLLERVPLDWLRDCLRVEGDRAGAALVFGEAGLLPSQRGRLPLDDYTREVEQIWRSRLPSAARPTLRWRWLGARPANTPVRRVAAALTLVGAAEGSLTMRALTALLELPPGRIAGALRRLLVSPGDQYWHSHVDFGRPLRSPTNVLGAERAGDLVVNVMLPWALALAHTREDPLMAHAVIDAYQAHPGLGTNQVTRHMARQVLGDDAAAVLKSACLQQGLIQLYRGWCDARDCATCPARMIELATFPGG